MSYSSFGAGLSTMDRSKGGVDRKGREMLSAPPASSALSAHHRARARIHKRSTIVPIHSGCMLSSSICVASSPVVAATGHKGDEWEKVGQMLREIFQGAHP